MNLLIILGSKLLKEGGISNILKNRLDKAAFLYKINKYNMIIVTGGNVEKSTILTEATAMKKYLTYNYNINPKIILEEKISIDTNENAIETFKIISNNLSIDNVTIVTSNFHIKRVKCVFTHYFQNKFNLIFEGSTNGIPHSNIEKVYINEKKCLERFIELIVNKPI
tara:strand:+ start:1256 stop:1756 length:501 start_codon:yes stop_codon:yes gene_type:complete